jgi:glycosyltransferase involved in cell wall biosynthesis
MRGLLITNCQGGMGGGEIAILRHLDHTTLPADRLAVALLNPGPLVQAIRERGVHCELIGRPGRDGLYPGPGERLQIAWRIARLVRRLNIGCVLPYTVPDLQSAILARRLVGFRLCWRSQGENTIFSSDRTQEPLVRSLIRGVRRHLDLTVSTTNWDRDVLVRYGVSAERVRTIYLGVDESWFRPKRASEGHDSARVRVIMSGRLVPWKGQRTFLRAFASAVSGSTNVEAWIIGNGAPDYRRALEEEAVRLEIGPQTRFFGHRDDVQNLLREGDIAVHCSEREPFGLVLIEAMACGLPVIASDVQGPREIVRHGETGYLVPPGDVAGFARYLRLLIEQPELRRQLGEMGRREAEVRFRAAANIPALERLALDNSDQCAASRLVRT